MNQTSGNFKRVLLGSVIAACMASFPVYAADADDMDKLFKEAMYQREQGNLFTSIEAFQSVLSNQPSMNRARLELAVSYYRTLNFEEARNQVQTVLDDPKTPANVRIAALAFLAQVNKDEEAMKGKLHVWSPSISVGVLFDSNVNAGPSSDILPGGLVLTPGSLPRSDEAVVLQAGLSHRYNSPKAVRIGESAASFVWQSQLNLYNRTYSSESDFDLTAITLATGPAWLVRNKWRANINLQADDIRLGNDHLALFTSVSPSITWDIKDGEVTLDGSFLQKDFKRASDAGRDSDYSSVGVALGKVIRTGTVAVQGGVKVFNEAADLSRFSNDGVEFFVGANLVAWNNGTVFGRISQKDAEFDGVEPVYNVARDETERRYEIGFNHVFREGKMNDWKLGGSYLNTDNSSNVSIYTYDREMTSINLSRSF